MPYKDPEVRKKKQLERTRRHLARHPGYYASRPKKDKDKHKITAKIRRDNNRTWATELKASKGCATCPEKDTRCLDFHHVDPKNKSFTISNHLHYARSALEAEINKCVVVCSNCHRKLENPV